MVNKINSGSSFNPKLLLNSALALLEEEDYTAAVGKLLDGQEQLESRFSREDLHTLFVYGKVFFDIDKSLKQQTVLFQTASGMGRPSPAGRRRIPLSPFGPRGVKGPNNPLPKIKAKLTVLENQHEEALRDFKAYIEVLLKKLK